MTFRYSILSGRLRADVSALADGSLAPGRRGQVERQIEASDELRLLFQQERAAVELVRQAREQDRAPASLRSRIARERLVSSDPARRRPRPLVSSLATATAVAIAAAVLLLTGGPTAGPSVAQAASLATRGAIAPAPGVNPGDPRALLKGVGEVYFPNWSRTLGWSATGQRADRLGGHRAVTVYYASHDVNVAYTIVSVPGLHQPPAEVVTIRGLRLRVLALAGRKVVTWRRDGRTCVLSSRSLSAPKLESLAAWS